MLSRIRGSTFSLLAVMLFVSGTLFVPVSAVYVQVTDEVQTQSLSAYSDGHTYVYAKTSDYQMTRQSIDLNADARSTAYRHQSGGWSRSQTDLQGPAVWEFQWNELAQVSWGPFGDGSLLPTFYDIRNLTETPTDIGAVSTRRAFPMQLGQESSVTLQSGGVAYGTFNITTEEFVHVTVGLRQDYCFLDMLILDPELRVMSEWFIDNGDIAVVPFKPSGPGMYSVEIFCYSDMEQLVVADITPEAVTPVEIAIGEVVEGVLSGSELNVDPETGSVVYQERAPSAHTYKVRSNWSHAAEVWYSLNLPELNYALYDVFEPIAVATGEGFFNAAGIIGSFQIELNNEGGVCHYQSFQNDSYYITLIGMENTAYTLYNTLGSNEPLPLNQEFFIENTEADGQTTAYELRLSEDAVIRPNGSASDAYEWGLWTVDDNMMFHSLPLEVAESLDDATTYYLPAGNYIVIATASSTDSSGFFEFNFGPVIDGAGQVDVSNGRVIGLRVPATTINWYAANLTLTTKDNVTVSADYSVISPYGAEITQSSATLANRQDGFQWKAYPVNTTEFSFMPQGGGSVIVTAAPWRVVNNTGATLDEYGPYTVSYSVVLKNITADVITGTTLLTLAGVPVTTGFTLPYPAGSTESYMMRMTCPEGIWLNVSLASSEITKWQAIVYYNLDGVAQVIGWSSLDDTATGTSTSRGSFQFGTPCTDVAIVLTVGRVGAEEGQLTANITPFATNWLLPMSPLRYQGAVGSGGTPGPAADPLTIAVAGGVVAVVVIAVAIAIYLKKKS